MFTLTISNPGRWNGRAPRVTHHETREAAWSALVAYVRDNFAAELGDEPEGEGATDESELVEHYFAETGEDFEITEA